MGNLSSITESIGAAGSGLNEFIDSNKDILGLVGAGAAGALAGGLVGYMVGHKEKKSKNKRSRKKRSRSRDWRFISKEKHEVAYQKRRRKQHKRTYGKHYKSKKSKIKHTKYGQPYIILKSGKARFIKKR